MDGNLPKGPPGSRSRSRTGAQHTRGSGGGKAKEGREVDFLVVRDRRPWFLVEVKREDCELSRSLKRFQDQLKAEHAFQAVIDLDYVAADGFQGREPVVVPARTLLSQLL